MSMKLQRFAYCIIFFFFSLLSVAGQDISVSQATRKSDIIRDSLLRNGLNPIVQELDNNLTQNYPYNIILEHQTQDNATEKSKLVIVIPQNFDINLLPSFISYIKKLTQQEFSFPIDIVFTANDIPVSTEKDFHSTYPSHVAAGSTTYINSLNTSVNVASVILTAQNFDAQTLSFSSLSLFNELVEVTPGGRASATDGLIAPLGFFKSVITSFAKSGVPYYIEGYFLTLYRLNFISNNVVLGTWLENDISSVALSLNEYNGQNIFLMLDSLLQNFTNADLTNSDINYSFFQLFSNTYFISEGLYLISLFISTALILFLFFYFSFMKGNHRNIHRQEFSKSWYLFPIIVFATALFLHLSINHNSS